MKKMLQKLPEADDGRVEIWNTPSRADSRYQYTPGGHCEVHYSTSSNTRELFPRDVTGCKKGVQAPLVPALLKTVNNYPAFSD